MNRVTVLFVGRFYVWLRVQIFHRSNCRRSKCHGTISDTYVGVNIVIGLAHIRIKVRVRKANV